MMQLNADFSLRVAVHAAQLPWVASPVAGIERRMLDRIGDEVARATSIVRYAAGSQFTAHVHGGGEEFLVLDGVFSDEHGDCPAGTYVRNPPTSQHTPHSGPGCTILVKLRQFDPDDRTAVRLAAGPDDFQPVPERAGVSVRALFVDQHEVVQIERWAAGSMIRQSYPEGVEVLVLEGSFAESGEAFAVQSWLRLPAPASLQAQAGAQGCLVWIKQGGILPQLSAADS
ncbi:cupin domain-containing protein [Actimicrobium sp. CCC2.4]|uniref:cupin domain-containing protein n=1 Tax=Actimicrobium sp. CCC2.4 TaxID=3048606 RepID=UPI002AC9273B|nr:cupin domain-containing protein [Actimicrobium sp. CCC2.4]MEB0137291.1 cupin domain-containing protein [Actimicrobium sp. CCC2.4]WPX32527.1 cupin domain-containing protein [Actimicrobium sp. CCC2.4]